MDATAIAIMVLWWFMAHLLDVALSGVENVHGCPARCSKRA
jgi:hypothetical protein